MTVNSTRDFSSFFLFFCLQPNFMLKFFLLDLTTTGMMQTSEGFHSVFRVNSCYQRTFLQGLLKQLVK